LPSEITSVLDTHPATLNAQLLCGLPEHRVQIPSGGRASQTCLWAILKTERGLASVVAEAKAREPFGPSVDEWLRGASEGTRVRG
jgi:hypothetical protein